MSAWIEAMKQGRFELAWHLNDLHRATSPAVCNPALPRHLQDIWNGSPLAGRRVLIRCYHGLGDTLQFIRYAPLVSAMAREVTTWMQPELIGLCSEAPGLGRLLPLHDGRPEVDFDVDVEVMELPYVFRTIEPTIPARVPYIRVAAPAARETNDYRVGLVWRAGAWDPRRSVPFALMRPLLALPGVRATPLQETLTPEERILFPSVQRPATLVDLAELILGQDLIITVDTMVAHLAGALGAPTWLLLHADPDWRWMRGRTDTPWYPTMMLYRQTVPGRWEDVVVRVAGRLREAVMARVRDRRGSG